MSENVAWTEEHLATLRRMWDEGDSTNTIARKLRRSKNSVVGKARRLDLPERVSPIIRSGAAHSPSIAPAGRVTLPKLASTATELFVTTLYVAPTAAARAWSHPGSPSPEDVARIKTLHTAGNGYKAICKTTGISDYFVRRALGYSKPAPTEREPVSKLPPVHASKPIFDSPSPVVEAPIHRADASQCQWLFGNRPYTQCSERALSGEGLPRPWSYCRGCREKAYVRRAA